MVVWEALGGDHTVKLRLALLTLCSLLWSERKLQCVNSKALGELTDDFNLESQLWSLEPPELPPCAFTESLVLGKRFTAYIF